MKIFNKSKDGGPESKVTGYWLVEIKPLFTVAILRFDEGSREAYHNHAFNAISWVLKGGLKEQFIDWPKKTCDYHYPSLWPIFTSRECMHKVYGLAPKTWVLTFRGPWAKTWNEVTQYEEKITLTHGRHIVSNEQN